MSTTGNPVIARLTRHSRWPPLWQCAALAAVLVLATVLYLNSIPAHNSEPPTLQDAFYRLAGILLLALALTFLVPALVGAVAATLAARHAGSEEFRRLSVSPLIPSTLVSGYLAAALYRARLALAVLVGLLPAFLRLYNPDQSRIDSALLNMIQCDAPNTITFPGFIPPGAADALSAVAATLALVSVSVAAAALGVWAGLALRRAVPAAALSAAGALALVYAVMRIVAPPDVCYGTPVRVYPLGDALVGVGVVAVVGLGLLGLAWAAARRAIRAAG